MKKHIVSLVSKHTIPNILFIKEMETMDNYIFIYTKEMVNELAYIIQTLELKDTQTQNIIVGAVSIQSIYLGIEKEALPKNDMYFINLTCGTKPMALTVFQYFIQADFPAVRMAYLPSREKTYEFIYPDISTPKPLTYQLNIQQFLSSYGVSLHSLQHDKTRPWAFVQKYTNAFIGLKKQNPPFAIDGINKLRKNHYTSKKNIALDELDTSILKTLKYHQFIKKGQKNISPQEIKFLTGSWFEEYVYQLVQQKSKLTQAFIAHNVEISKNGPDREMDVFFIHKNTPYYIECKTSIKLGRDYAKTLYKLTSLRDILGIDLQIVLILLTDVNTRYGKYVKNNPIARAEHHRIHLIHRKDFEQGALEQYLDKVFGS